MTAVIKSACEAVMLEASGIIKSGGLVAFPTETVYGLGANALDASAVAKIYAAKGRPLTDPVIAHVSDKVHALSIVNLEPGRMTEVFHALADRFWPGPLTLLCPANAQVPPINTANTGIIGVRVPSNPIAKKLIELSGTAIAAPSANRFGHVSPTSAQHVFDDLSHSPMLIIDAPSPCQFGIESTIVQICAKDAVSSSSASATSSSSSSSAGASDHVQLRLVRRGAISEASVRELLSSLSFPVNMEVVKRAESTEKSQEAPGQLLTHYSPDIDAFVLKKQTTESSGFSANLNLENVVIIDFGKSLSQSLKPMARFDLSENGNGEEAARSVFGTLRMAESVQGAKAIVLPDMTGINELGTEESVGDRLFRASSGKICYMSNDGSKILIPQ